MGNIMSAERTFIAVKPDGVQRGLIGEIIKRFEQKGFKMCGMKFMQASEEHMKKHYEDLLTSLSTLALLSTCPPLHSAPCAGRELKLSRLPVTLWVKPSPSTPSLAASVVTSALKLAETSFMALTLLNQPIRNLLSGSNLRNSSAGPKATTAGSTSKPRATGEGLETYCF